MDYIITSDTGGEYLSHYGVLGMKWGHRKANIHDATIQDNKRTRQSDRKYRSDLKNARSRYRSDKRNAFIKYQDNKINASNKAIKRNVDSTVQYGKKLSDNGVTSGKAFAQAALAGIGGYGLSQVAGNAVFAATRNVGASYIATMGVGAIGGAISGKQLVKGISVSTYNKSKKK